MNTSRIIGAIAVVLFVVMGVCGVAIAQTQLDIIEQKVKQTNWIVKGVSRVPKLMYGQRQIKQTASTTFPIIIDQPGSYVITSNLTVLDLEVSAIEIDTDNVTLDLNGHTISGPGAVATAASGIYARERYKITIKNGIVRNFNIGVDVVNSYLNPDAGHRIEGIQASNNGEGIKASYSTLTDCTATDNGSDGINASNSTLTNCTATGNIHGRGINASNSTLTNCTATNNGSDGINASDSTVTNCTATDNGNYGINASDSTVTNCTASNNLNDGILIDRSTLTNCTATNNGSDGIDASYSTLTNCTASGNFYDGINADRSNVKGCNVRNNNSGWGITMSQDNHNYIYGNSASRNGAGQINCPTGNTCVDNAEF